MATYLDKYTADTLNGKNVGIIFGKTYAGVALTGNVNSSNKDFTFPLLHIPFYPRDSCPADMIATKDDVTVYCAGVEQDVTAFDPDTGVASIDVAPTTGAMTGDYAEQLELYIATDFKLDSKQEDDKLEQLRNSTTRHSYGNIEFTMKANFKLADTEVLKFLFEATTPTGAYEFPSTPPTVYAMIPIERTVGASTTIEGIIYCHDCRAMFGDILDAKAGKDALKNSLELSFGTQPVLIIVDEVE